MSVISAFGIDAPSPSSCERQPTMTDFIHKVKKEEELEEELEDMKEEAMKVISNRSQQSSLPSTPQLSETVYSPALIVSSTKLRAAGPLRGGGGGHHHQVEMRLFKKAKSAATFTLDGVSYTIGKCTLNY